MDSQETWDGITAKRVDGGTPNPRGGRERDGRRAVRSEMDRIYRGFGRAPRLTLNEEPVVNDSLNVGVEEAGDVMTHL